MTTFATSTPSATETTTQADKRICKKLARRFIHRFSLHAIRRILPEAFEAVAPAIKVAGMSEQMMDLARELSQLPDDVCMDCVNGPIGAIDAKLFVIQRQQRKNVKRLTSHLHFALCNLPDCHTDYSGCNITTHYGVMSAIEAVAGFAVVGEQLLYKLVNGQPDYARLQRMATIYAECLLDAADEVGLTAHVPADPDVIPTVHASMADGENRGRWCDHLWGFFNRCAVWKAVSPDIEGAPELARRIGPGLAGGLIYAHSCRFAGQPLNIPQHNENGELVDIQTTAS